MGYRKLKSDGKMPYVWLKYEDVIRKSVNAARGLLEGGLAIGQQTMVGIYSANRPEVSCNIVSGLTEFHLPF